MKLLDCFLDAVRKRRSRYQLTKEISVADNVIEKTIATALECVPAAFNSQSARVVLLFGEHHHKLWQIVMDELSKVVSKDKLANTKLKIDMFNASRGTVLFFEDESIIKSLENKYPLYADNFWPWAYESNGMLQYIVWTAFSQMGLGANVQHYNPLIDAAVHKIFGIDSRWKLLAQMPFGKNKVDSVPKKEIVPLSQRFRVMK